MIVGVELKVVDLKKKVLKFNLKPNKIGYINELPEEFEEDDDDVSYTFSSDLPKPLKSPSPQIEKSSSDEEHLRIRPNMKGLNQNIKKDIFVSLDKASLDPDLQVKF